jgi:ABC-type hemin transport system substrate-binding protein
LRTFILFILVFLSNCSQVSIDEQADGVRIVSLSPGITASLIDMGFTQQIVGRSPFCEDRTNSIPVVGDLNSINYERLVRLRPTHVFLQNRLAGIDSHLADLAKSGAFILRSWELDSVAHIQLLGSELAEILDVNEPYIDIKLSSLQVSDAPTLLMTNGSQQQIGLCFGKNTYLDDLIKEMGGVNALSTSGWSMLSLEDIARLSPSRIIIVSDVSFTQSSPVESLDIPVTKFVHKDVLIPSTRIVEVAQALHQSMVGQQ